MLTISEREVTSMLQNKKKTGRKFTASLMALVMLFSVIAPAKQAQMAGVSISKTKLTLIEGKSATLSVKGTKKTVKWSSSKKTVATVTSKGKVTAVKAGKATIKAKVAKKTYKCAVTVKERLSKYWSSSSAAAKKIRAYVKKVTNSKDTANYIPKEDRIAVFDMDGTLVCETYYTYFDTMMFKQYVSEHPELSDDVKNYADKIEPGYKADEGLAKAFAKAYTGLTIQQMYDYAVEFGNLYTDSFENMRYFDGAYLPMVELIEYLYDEGFAIYVVSGTETTTVRAVVDNSPYKKYVLADHIIGSEFEIKVKGNEDQASNMSYNYESGDELVFTGKLTQKNLNANKVIEISKQIGKKPVLSFGNAGSDASMCTYAISNNKYPAEAYMLVADDNIRDWGEPENWESKSTDFSSQGFTPISMKNEFVSIYSAGITKAAEQKKSTEVPKAA